MRPQSATSLTWQHSLLALAIVAIWGSNFVLLKLGLRHLPPLFLACLRFFFAFMPLIFFLKRPNVPLHHVAAYGLLAGAGQFGLLFIAMRHDITPGLASLVVQMQVFFTIGLALWLNKERLYLFQLFALLLALSGIALILMHDSKDATFFGVSLTLLAGLSWAGGNIVSRHNGRANMLSYVVWAGLFTCPPLLALSLVFEGWPAIYLGLQQADAITWTAVVWQSAGNAVFGYASWAWLLARYPAATVTPWALLVPVFGMGASALVLGEAMPLWKITAALLIISGLAVNLTWPKLRPFLGLKP